MKRACLALSVCLALALSLSACAAQRGPAPAAVPTPALNADYPNAVSVELQLLLGTLSLSGDLAITPQQAQALLPLWTQLKSLSRGIGMNGQGGAAAQSGANAADVRLPQIELLLAQVEAVLTPEQLAAIAAMKLTPEAAAALFAQYGIDTSEQPGTFTPQMFDPLLKALGAAP